MDNDDRAVQGAMALLRYGGWVLSETDVAWLAGRSETRPSPEDLKSQAEAALRGFFRAVDEGHLFADENEIKRRFGKSVVENYPEGSVEFLDFARTYWTMRLVVDQAVTATSSAAGLLEQIERIIGPLFFPTPGLARVDPAKRESDQRGMIRWSGAVFDVNEFITGNPILIRDRSASNRGCFGILVCLLVAGAGVLVALLVSVAG